MKKWITRLILLLTAGILMLPVYGLLAGSFYGDWELRYHLGPVLNNGKTYASFSLLPQYPSAQSYRKLLLETPEYYIMFWNSVKLTGSILAGQFLIAVPAAWGFSRMKGRFRDILFQIYIVLMMMPFQVTMLSNYLTLNTLKMTDTHWSIILPAVCSTFPVFLMHRFFSNIPVSVLEAARMEGAGRLRIFTAVGIPMGASGIASAMILGFFEYWNLVEQPLVFLKSKALWPLSLYLPNIGSDMAGVAFTASVVSLIPAVLVFLRGQVYLERGIAAATMKG